MRNLLRKIIDWISLPPGPNEADFAAINAAMFAQPRDSESYKRAMAEFESVFERLDSGQPRVLSKPHIRRTWLIATSVVPGFGLAVWECVGGGTRATGISPSEAFRRWKQFEGDGFAGKGK